MSAPRYARISSSDDSSYPEDYGINSPQRSGASRTQNDRLGDKIVALAWVILAMLVAYWSRFFSVVLFSKDANRIILNVSFLCFGTVIALALYLMVYLPMVIKLKDPEAWSVYCPKVVPTMVVSSIVGFILLIRGTWPVWGFLAPLILAIEFMGFLFSLHFVPCKPTSVVYV